MAHISPVSMLNIMIIRWDIPLCRAFHVMEMSLNLHFVTFYSKTIGRVIYSPRCFHKRMHEPLNRLLKGSRKVNTPLSIKNIMFKGKSQ